jgi:ABC-type Fe3+ transport system permease subunit
VGSLVNAVIARNENANLSKVWLRALAALLLAVLAPVLTFAQNCALCYTQAAGSGSRMIHALKSGILILMIPPMCICIGITVMAWKKRNQFNDDFETEEK